LAARRGSHWRGRRPPAEHSKNRRPRVLPVDTGPLALIISVGWRARRLDCALIFHQNGRRIGDFRKRWPLVLGAMLDATARGLNELPTVHLDAWRDWRPRSARTAFRQGNQFRLAWSDVNLEAATVRARRSKSGEDYHVPLNDELRAILRTLPSRLRSASMFPSETGETPLDAKNYMHRVFAPALKRARIGDFRWHDLRHTFASRLTMAGVDLATVQRLMATRRWR
jgi:hypothetical protein